MSHAIHDKRSLLMHRLIAWRLRHDPSLRVLALENIRRWTEGIESSESTSHAAKEWLPLLDGSLERLVVIMKDKSEEGKRLRQSSPFAGESFLKQTERMRILSKFRS